MLILDFFPSRHSRDLHRDRAKIETRGVRLKNGGLQFM